MMWQRCPELFVQRTHPAQTMLWIWWTSQTPPWCWGSTGYGGTRCGIPMCRALPDCWTENLQLDSTVICNRWGKSKKHLLALGRRNKLAPHWFTKWVIRIERKQRHYRMNFAFRSASSIRIFNICHILSSGTVTHLDQDSFMVQFQANYKRSPQTKSTLMMTLKKTML